MAKLNELIFAVQNPVNPIHQPADGPYDVFRYDTTASFGSTFDSVDSQEKTGSRRARGSVRTLERVTPTISGDLSALWVDKILQNAFWSPGMTAHAKHLDETANVAIDFQAAGAVNATGLFTALSGGDWIRFSNLTAPLDVMNDVAFKIVEKIDADNAILAGQEAMVVGIQPASGTDNGYAVSYKLMEDGGETANALTFQLDHNKTGLSYQTVTGAHSQTFAVQSARGQAVRFDAAYLGVFGRRKSIRTLLTEQTGSDPGDPATNAVIDTQQLTTTNISVMIGNSALDPGGVNYVCAEDFSWTIENNAIESGCLYDNGNPQRYSVDQILPGRQRFTGGFTSIFGDGNDFLAQAYDDDVPVPLAIGYIDRGGGYEYILDIPAADVTVATTDVPQAEDQRTQLVAQWSSREEGIGTKDPAVNNTVGGRMLIWNQTEVDAL
jgi:hypothetical protein